MENYTFPKGVLSISPGSYCLRAALVSGDSLDPHFILRKNEFGMKFAAKGTFEANLSSKLVSQFSAEDSVVAVFFKKIEQDEWENEQFLTGLEVLRLYHRLEAPVSSELL